VTGLGLFDAGVFAAQAANYGRVVALDSEPAGSLGSVYMVSYFAVGAARAAPLLRSSDGRELLSPRWPRRPWPLRSVAPMSGLCGLSIDRVEVAHEHDDRGGQRQGDRPGAQCGQSVAAGRASQSEKDAPSGRVMI